MIVCVCTLQCTCELSCDNISVFCYTSVVLSKLSKHTLILLYICHTVLKHSKAFWACTEAPKKLPTLGNLKIEKMDKCHYQKVHVLKFMFAWYRRTCFNLFPLSNHSQSRQHHLLSVNVYIYVKRQKKWFA